MLRLSLTSAGFDVTEASTSSDAFRSLGTISPDAVIINLGSPGGLGDSVLDQLSLDDREQNSPPWVVISSLDRDEAADQGSLSGAHFITKPFDPWDLVRLIESLLQMH